MNGTINKNTSKFKTAVVVLSVIALILKFLVFSVNFIRSNISIDSIDISRLTNLFFNMLTIGVYIFLLIYAAVFHNKPKANMFLMIVFLLLSFNDFCSIVSEFLFYSVWYPARIPALLLYFVRFAAVVLFALAAVSAAKGFKTKSLVIVAIINEFVIILLSFVMNIFIAFLYGYGMWSMIMILINLVGILASLFFNLALLFAGLGCGSGQEKPRELSVEEKLRFLNESLSRGEISFEAYNQQRAEILGRL